MLICQRQRATVQLEELELVPELLLQEQLGLRRGQPEQHILEHKEPKLERHTMVPSGHRRVHRPQEPHNLEPLVHRLEHRRPEQHSLVSPYSTPRQVPHRTASANRGRASASSEVPSSEGTFWEAQVSGV